MRITKKEWTARLILDKLDIVYPLFKWRECRWCKDLIRREKIWRYDTYFFICKSCAPDSAIIFDHISAGHHPQHSPKVAKEIKVTKGQATFHYGPGQMIPMPGQMIPIGNLGHVSNIDEVFIKYLDDSIERGKI